MMHRSNEQKNAGNKNHSLQQARQQEQRKPLHILVLNWQCWMNPFAGGAETHLREMFTRLVTEHGHRVTLFCCMFPGAKKHEVVDGVTIIREGHRNIFNMVVLYRYLRTLRHEQYDIIVDDINKIPFFTPLFVRKPLLALAHHFFGTSIFTEVGIVGGSYVYGAEMLVPLVYRTTQFVSVSDSTTQEFIRRGCDRSHFTIIPNCITKEQFPFAITAKTVHPRIVYCGRLKRYKSIDHVLRAFCMVLQHHPQADLVIAGRGEAEQELKELSKELGIAQAVSFVGFISEEEKVHLLSEAWCMVNPSMKEGWGIVNIEANACGTPVVSANSPGLRDSVRDGKSGILYRYGSIDELAHVLSRVINDESLRRHLSEGAIQWARAFDWNHSAESLNECLYRVMEGQSFTPSEIPPAVALVQTA